jgi:hypothetical protein
MHELTRLAYLDAMGIDSYVPRGSLPAAAPSRHLQVIRRALPGSDPERPAVPVAAPTGNASAQLKASLGVATERSRAGWVPADTGPAVPAQGTAEMPVFSLAAVGLGGWYWLDEIPPGRDLGHEYLQLLQAIAAALGMDAGQPVFEQFNWPLHTSTQLDRDEEAARGGLGGFLARRFERYQPTGVILLGEMEQGWFDRELLRSHRVVATVSAWKMLREPALKRQAWTDLQVLRESPA